MKISGISASLPSRIVTNDEVLDLIKYHSRDTYQGDINDTIRKIRGYLRLTGIKNRRWLDAKESPMELLKLAFDNALKQSGLSKSDIDLLIYTGVGKGFVEPASSYMIADYLGLENVRNFDVVDACMGWISSLDIINDKMKAGAIQNALVVNMEFNLLDGGNIFPQNFKLQSIDELEYIFPSFTIGEATSATILTNSAPDNFNFEFRSLPSVRSLCIFPLVNWDKYCIPDEKMSKARINGSYSYGADLHDLGMSETVKVFNQLELATDDIDKVFVHASSKNKWTKVAKNVGIADKVFHISHETGNLVSASLPTAVDISINQKAISKGDSCLFWVGSAGMSFAAVNFSY